MKLSTVNAIERPAGLSSLSKKKVLLMVILATLSDDDEDYVNKVVRDVQVCPRNFPKFVQENCQRLSGLIPSFSPKLST